MIRHSLLRAAAKKRVPVGGVTSRYWRIYITLRRPNTNGSGYMNIGCGLASVAGGENICANGSGGIIAGATAAVSTEYNASYGGAAGFSVNRAGTVGGFWHTAYQAAPWWISIDFGAGNEKTIAELFIRHYNTLPDERTPYAFVLQKSADGITWVDVLTVNSTTTWAQGELRAWALP